MLLPEAEAVRVLASPAGELAALGLEGPAIGAAQRRLAPTSFPPGGQYPGAAAGPGQGGAERAVGAAIFAWTGKACSGMLSIRDEEGRPWNGAGKREGLSWKKDSGVFDLPGDVVSGPAADELEPGAGSCGWKIARGILSYGGEESHISGGQEGGTGPAWSCGAECKPALITGVITAMELE